jgi:hypothetical protein
MTYEIYTQLLGKRIHKTATEKELKQIDDYERDKPISCPHCGARVHSYMMPEQIVHDMEGCQKTPVAKSKPWEDD